MIIKVKVAETDLELSFDIDIETKTVHYLKVLIARDSFSLPVKEQRLEFAKNGHLRRLKNSHLINYYGLSEQNNLLTLKHQSAIAHLRIHLAHMSLKKKESRFYFRNSSFNKKL